MCLFSTVAFARSRGGHLISTTDIPQVWDFVPLEEFQILVVLTKMKKYIYLKEKHICHQPHSVVSLAVSWAAPLPFRSQILADTKRVGRPKHLLFRNLTRLHTSNGLQPFTLMHSFHFWFFVSYLVSPIEELGTVLFWVSGLTVLRKPEQMPILPPEPETGGTL